MDKSPRFVSALVGALAAFGVVGAGWAWAQEAPTTTTPPTTTAPSQDGGSTTAPDNGGRHCDHDGDGQPDAPASSSQTNL